MASQLLSQEEKDHIDDVFRHLDTSCDGQLDRGDLKRGYKEYFNTEPTDTEVDNLFDEVNFSGSGAIEYSEFAIAILMAKDKVDDTKLKAAFNIFDEEGKGYISSDDIKRVLNLGDDQDDYLRKKILRQVNAEDTGRIDFGDFKRIMRSNKSLKKKKKLPIKRSPRRAVVSSQLSALDFKEFQNASAILECNLLMDASELSNASGHTIGLSHYGQQRRPNLQDLSENDDEDQSSERDVFSSR